MQQIEWVKGDAPVKYEGVLLFLLILNVVFLLAQIVLNVGFIRALKWDFLRRLYSWVDLTMVVTHILVFYFFFTWLYLAERTPEANFEDHVKTIRYCNVVNILCQFIRFTYFLTLFDQLAWLVDIIKEIFVDIFYFMIIMGLVVFGFSLCFMIVGQN